MVTYTGKVINLFDPNPDDICLEDIAHGLAHTCRFNGHTKKYYSVAEHCTWMYAMVPDYLKPLVLLHDAEEAYFGDIITPIKAILKSEGSALIEAMRNMRTLILKKFGVDWDARIKDHDAEMLTSEWNNLILKDNWGGESPIHAKTGWLSLAHYHFGKQP